MYDILGVSTSQCVTGCSQHQFSLDPLAGFEFDTVFYTLILPDQRAGHAGRQRHRDLRLLDAAPDGVRVLNLGAASPLAQALALTVNPGDLVALTFDLGDIARVVGYGHLSVFTKAFTTAHGTSPTAYRRQTE